MLATAEGFGTMAIMRATGMSKPSVWRWQERYAAEGVDGLTRDKTRPGRKKPLSDAVKQKVLTLTARETPANATHWSAASMAKAVGISISSVQRIWDETALQPHRVAKLQALERSAVRGEGDRHRRPVHAPARRALVLCVDEKVRSRRSIARSQGCL